MTTEPPRKHRSGCPLSVSLDTLGDRWSLLIVRDLMVRGCRTFREFQQDGDGIASNILSNRLHRLEATGILTTEPAERDARSTHYRLTPKGIALAPVLLEIFIWAGHHEETGAPGNFVEHLVKNREAVLAETYRRWEKRDHRPLIPSFSPLARREKGKRPR